MRKAIKASRLIGLLALALGLMAISAGAAQAESGAFWEVNGSSISGSLKVEGGGEIENSGVLLTKIGTSKIEISCPTIKAVNLILEKSGSGSGKGHLEECTTKLNGTLASRCTPKSPGASTGLIETNALKGLLKLTAAKEDVLELAPESGTAFVTLELGALCAIGNKFDITGQAFVKDCQGEGSVNRVKHLVEEGPESALLFGGNAATIDGSAFVFLVGAHEGMTFSGHPA